MRDLFNTRGTEGSVFAQAIDSFLAYFRYPSPWGIGIASLFAVIWLAIYRPPLFKQPVAWLMLAGGAAAGLLATAFVLSPVNSLTHMEQYILKGETGKLLLVGLLVVIAGGLVQESAKLLPVWLAWKRSGKTLEPRMGLLLGAAAGIGFGLLEAQWVHNLLFATGWNWNVIPAQYISALITFWERLVMVGLHAGMTALAGWGMAKGKCWQYFLAAAGLHALINYLSFMMAGAVIGIFFMELALTVIVLVLTVVMVSMRGELIKN